MARKETAEAKNLKQAGWGKSPASRVWHYFPAGESFSLCHKIGFYFGERDDTADDHSQNCATCRRKVKQIRGRV